MTPSERAPRIAVRQPLEATMSSRHDPGRPDPRDRGTQGHPSQAEGEDPDAPEGTDPWIPGHPSQAEGEDPDDDADS
ncbi:hypothetical protein [Microbacterium resistens]|uniref:hypothetical protein n=1 Tax=Microbacterium resistens TaxID=156977 RepID=UPI001C569DA0|nr:hypothetical protein [Microbacterium resistens]